MKVRAQLKPPTQDIPHSAGLCWKISSIEIFELWYKLLTKHLSLFSVQHHFVYWKEGILTMYSKVSSWMVSMTGQAITEELLETTSSNGSNQLSVTWTHLKLWESCLLHGLFLIQIHLKHINFQSLSKWTSQCESRKRRMGADAFSTPRSRALASPTLEPDRSQILIATIFYRCQYFSKSSYR